MTRTRPWEVSDELWERVRPLIPPRPAADDRQTFAAIVYVLRTGMQWNALPRELGASSTVYDRFRDWEAPGFFQRLWQAELERYDELVGIAWDWQSVDSSTVKAPFAKAAVGPAPTDRGKQGTKRSLLCDRRGLPLALTIEGANRHDSKLLFPTLDALALDRPEPTGINPQNVCLDAAYDYDPIYEPSKTPRRWVVERLFSWLNRWRRLLIRWEKLGETYQAF